MANDLKKVKIKDLPNTETLTDSYLFPNTNTLETCNVTADSIAEYVSKNKNITENYINKNQIGVANGITPLNENVKINGEYITYGKTDNTAYSGLAGKTLETNLDNHLLDENAHGLGNVDNTSDMDKPVSTAQQTALNNAIKESKEYTDTRFDEILGEGASVTLDTIGEISKAIEEHQEVTDALNAAIGTKANESDLTNHINNVNNPHNVTKEHLGLGNVENKSSEVIRSELTKEDIINALGYTPGTGNGGIEEDTNTTYSLSKSGNTITLTGSDGSTTSVADSNTTYSAATTSKNGLMTSEMVTKLNNIETGANAYTLPTANSSTLGGVKTTSEVTSTEGLIPCPIIDGVPYYGDVTKEIISDIEPDNQPEGDYWIFEY